MNSTVLPYFHFDMNGQCFAAARLTWPAYDDGRKRENSPACKNRIIVESTCRRSVEYGCYITCLTLDVKWCLSDDKNSCLCITSSSLAMTGEHRKRHTMRAHQPEAISDWLNPFSLGTMSASAYIDYLG